MRRISILASLTAARFVVLYDALQAKTTANSTQEGVLSL
jgi:hypothetical protein